MDQPSPIAVASLMLNIVVMKGLVVKGVISVAELKTAIDESLLIFEESGLAAGDQGRAVHATLEMILGMISGQPILP